jgi:hypothetical protein
VAVWQRVWQVLAERFAGALRRQPAAATPETPATTGRDSQQLSGLVTGLQAEVERIKSAAGQEQSALQDQLAGMRAGFDREIVAAGLDQQGIREELADVQAGIEEALAGLRQDQQGFLAQLAGLQDELAQSSRRIEQVHAVQQQQLGQIRAEQDATQEEVISLRAALTDSSVRQEAQDARVGTLEIHLREQEQKHRAAMQQLVAREGLLARRLNMALAVAIAAVLLGMVIGAVNYREVKNTNRLLAEMSRGIQDLRASLVARPVTEPPAAVAAAPEAQPVSPAPAVQASLAPGREAAVPSAQALPQPAFVVSQSLSLAGHTFRTREDARAFFEDNARQPGVVTLPGGLQYRELIAGSGRTPGINDRVEVEYRAFRPDGTETDNSFRQQVPKILTVGTAPAGLKEALLHMAEGAQWELYIPASDAYPGTRKRGPFGFEPVILTLELISIIAPDENP